MAIEKLENGFLRNINCLDENMIQKGTMTLNVMLVLFVKDTSHS